jgi:hypothetical protein
MSRDQRDENVQLYRWDEKEVQFLAIRGVGKVQVIATRRNEEEVQFFAVRGMRRRFSFPPLEI